MSLQPEVSQSDLPAIKYLIDEGDTKAAGQALTNYLQDAPDDPGAIFLMGRVALESDQPALAKIIYENMVREWPENPAGWQNLGKAYDHLNLAEKAEGCFKKVLELDPENLVAIISLSTNYVQQYRSDEAIEWADKALKMDSKNLQPRSNKGYAYIQKREFGKGWDEYEYGLGRLRWRNKKSYTGEPQWDGERGKKLIIYGEQGLGDQIAGLEPVKDAMKDNQVVAIDVGPKLKNLVARSFPGVEVHGHLYKEEQDWHAELDVDAAVSVFSLHRHYRRKEADYKGKPYLIADPVRRIGWRAILDSLSDKPKIGIAWSGGISLTQRAARRCPLEKLLPVFDQDATFINLEYRDRSEEIAEFERRRGVKIHDFPWALQSSDYDDTAALVAELDAVITVPTSVVHLAGALGVPTLVLTHPRPNIHYSAYGSKLAYYGTVDLIRRKTDDEWDESVLKAAEWVNALARREAA